MYLKYKTEDLLLLYKYNLSMRGGKMEKILDVVEIEKYYGSKSSLTKARAIFSYAVKVSNRLKS